MASENKELLVKYLCMALPYGVKIWHTGWDSDSGTDFDTVETLIGIDDKFIYTVWDKTGDRKKHYLSVSNWKPYLRPMSSMTDEEAMEYANCGGIIAISPQMNYLIPNPKSINWLLEHHFDFMGLIPKNLAIEVTEYNNPYKE